MATSGPSTERPVALVTGGSGGIGRASVVELASHGFDVAFTYRKNAAPAQELAASTIAGARLIAEPLEMSRWDDVVSLVDRLAARFGRLDVIVHAAGDRVQWAYIHDLAVEDWNSYLAADLTGAFNVVRAALPHLRRNGGCFVFISSIAAKMCQPRNVQGAVAKAGVEALMRVLAREEARNKIRSNAIAVGLTDTAMGRDAIARWGAARAEKVIEAIPLRRMGTPAEIARAVRFLVSDEGAYITGQVLQVDGGQFIAA